MVTNPSTPLSDDIPHNNTDSTAEADSKVVSVKGESKKKRKKQTKSSFDDDFFSFGDVKHKKKKKKSSTEKSQSPGPSFAEKKRSLSEETAYIFDTKEPPKKDIMGFVLGSSENTKVNEYAFFVGKGISSQVTDDDQNEADFEEVDVEETAKPENADRPRTRSSRPSMGDLQIVTVEEEDDDSDDRRDYYDDYYSKIIASVKELGDLDEDDYQFSDENESKRPYVLKVIPKGYSGNSQSFATKGTKLFEQVLAIIVSFYKKQAVFPKNISPKDYTLFWIEGKREIKSTYQPRTLRIKPPVPDDLVTINDLGHTLITCLLIPRRTVSDALNLYDELKPKYAKIMEFERKLKLAHGDDSVINDDVLINEFNFSDDENQVTTNIEEIDDDDDDGNAFKIGLKGKDNKRIIVKVKPDTKVLAILEYFLQHTQMDVSGYNISRTQLLFDCEPLDLNDVVSNTELEEDFEIQVVFH